MAITLAQTAAPAVAYDNFSTDPYTFSAQSIGAAASDRIVVVGVAWGPTNDRALTSMTIGGVAATIIGGSADGCAIGYAAVPTGTTADIVLDWPYPVQLVGVSVWRLVGAESSYSASGAKAYSWTATSALASAIIIPTDGVGICIIETEANVSITWTDATADSYNHNANGNAMGLGAAHHSTAGSWNPSASHTGTGTGMYAVTWAPAAGAGEPGSIYSTIEL
jgi:hypothetical protein